MLLVTWNAFCGLVWKGIGKDPHSKRVISRGVLLGWGETRCKHFPQRAYTAGPRDIPAAEQIYYQTSVIVPCLKDRLTVCLHRPKEPIS